MLKYRLNIRQLSDTATVIPVIRTQINDIYDNNKTSLTVFAENIDDIHLGSQILCNGKIRLADNASDKRDYNFTKSYEVISVDTNQKSFNIIVDKFTKLKPISVYIENEGTEYELPGYGDITDEELAELPKYTIKRYLTFIFKESHYFNETSDLEIGEPDLSAEDDSIDDNAILNVPRETNTLYIKYEDEDGQKQIEELYMYYDTPTSLRVPFDDFVKNHSVLCSMFFGTTDATELESAFTANISGVDVYRDNVLMDFDGGCKYYVDRAAYKFQLPLINKSDNSLMQPYAIEENFSKIAKENSINRVVEMEKDVYHPKIKYNNKFEPVYKIKFNLHFRQHRGDDWLADDECLWNGVDGGNFQDNFFSYNDKSKQSDLLSYLGFTNNDIKFQKNRLKKSFLRISFYDSPNTATQNLLCYSTVFFNTGKLFAKLMRHLETTPYTMLTYEGDTATITNNLTGIKVNREPSNTTDMKEDDIEDMRLSSQFVITDKYHVDSSSEGFYLYLWKDNDTGLYPTDIYMKVDFNHAGYGRTIPFMMPYWNSNKWNDKTREVTYFEDNEEKTKSIKFDKKIGIKTYEEILKDWRSEIKRGEAVPKYDNEKTDGAYGIIQYLRYNYIHFKYQYDDIKNEHIYYLDDDTYGANCAYDKNEPNTLTINLYEAKIGETKNNNETEETE